MSDNGTNARDDDDCRKERLASACLWTHTSQMTAVRASCTRLPLSERTITGANARICKCVYIPVQHYTVSGVQQQAVCMSMPCDTACQRSREHVVVSLSEAMRARGGQLVRGHESTCWSVGSAHQGKQKAVLIAAVLLQCVCEHVGGAHLICECTGSTQEFPKRLFLY